MKTKRQKIGGWLWGLSGILIAIGYIIHPPLTVDGMLQSIWVPDHIIIMISFFTFAFALNLITLDTKERINTTGWIGYVLLSLSIFLIIGIVYFELYLIPILAVDLPGLFDEGLRIGPLKIVLPVTALLLVLGHLFYGISFIKKKLLPTIPFVGLIVFSAPLAFKPVLPDIIATIGAIGYGIFAIYFAIQYSKSEVGELGES